MKIVTANRLADGAVVYLAGNDCWTEHLAAAEMVADDAADVLLERASRRTHEIAGAYLVVVDSNGAPAGREALREAIRAAGPTVRPDLNRQAG